MFQGESLCFSLAASSHIFPSSYGCSQGLGRRSQGRLEPVEIVVLPAGKSLDACAALKEAEKVRKIDASQKGTRRRRKKGNSRQHGGEVEEREAMDMFDFLNTKILNRGVSWCDELNSGWWLVECRVVCVHVGKRGRGSDLVRKGSTSSSAGSSKSLNLKVSESWQRVE